MAKLTPSSEELQIEKDHLAAIDHARAMYYMGLQVLERQLDQDLAKAAETYEARLRQARHEAHRAVEKGC